jgi:hypothetical protein
VDLLGAHGGAATSFPLPDSSIRFTQPPPPSRQAQAPAEIKCQQQQHVSTTSTSPGSCWDHGNGLRSRRRRSSSSSRLSGRRRSQAASYAAAIAQCYSGPRPCRSDLPRPPPPPAPLGFLRRSQQLGAGRNWAGKVLGGGRWAARTRRTWGGGGGGGRELEVVEQWGIWSGAASPNPPSFVSFLPSLPFLVSVSVSVTSSLSGFFFGPLSFQLVTYIRVRILITAVNS